MFKSFSPPVKLDLFWRETKQEREILNCPFKCDQLVRFWETKWDENRWGFVSMQASIKCLPSWTISISSKTSCRMFSSQTLLQVWNPNSDKDFLNGRKLVMKQRILGKLEQVEETHRQGHTGEFESHHFMFHFEPGKTSVQTSGPRGRRFLEHQQTGSTGPGTSCLLHSLCTHLEGNTAALFSPCSTLTSLQWSSS